MKAVFPTKRDLQDVLAAPCFGEKIVAMERWPDALPESFCGCLLVEHDET
jgi:hypothetical protein